MSKKALDRNGRWRNHTVAFRVSPEENDAINQMSRLTGLTKQDYIIQRLLKKDVVVHGNPRVFKALKCELLQVAEELHRLTSAAEISDEMQETIRILAAICGEGLKEELIQR